MLKRYKLKITFIELNDKYMLPPRRFLEIVREEGVTMVRGLDAHSIDELALLEKR